MSIEELIKNVNLGEFEYNEFTHEYYLKSNLDITIKEIKGEERFFEEEDYKEHSYIKNIKGDSCHVVLGVFYKGKRIYNKNCIYCDQLLKPYFLPYPKKLDSEKKENLTLKNEEISFFSFKRVEIEWFNQFCKIATKDQFSMSINLLSENDNIIIN